MYRKSSAEYRDRLTCIKVLVIIARYCINMIGRAKILPNTFKGSADITRIRQTMTNLTNRLFEDFILLYS